MRIKTMIIIFITVLLTVVLMQNTQVVAFNFLFATFYMPKLVMLTAVSVVALILGILIGRPGRPRYIPGHDEEIEPIKNTPGTLSDEDRDYIS